MLTAGPKVYGHSRGVLIVRALVYGVDIRAPDFWELPYEPKKLT